MKRTLLAAALAMAASAAWAQPTPTPAPAAPVVDAPKPNCVDPGQYPGRVGMLNDDRRNKFLKAVETYKTCMLNFIEERKAIIKANENAARAAIDDYNTRMKRYNEEQEKAQ